MAISIIPIAILFVGLIWLIGKVMYKRTFKYLSAQLIYSLLALYIVFGIVSGIVFANVEKNPKFIEVSKEQQQNVEAETNRLLDLVSLNSFEQIDEKYVQKQQRFTVESEKRDYNLYYHEGQYHNVYVSYNDDPAANEIIATTYVTNIIVNGYDVSSLIEPAEVKVEGGLIEIKGKESTVTETKIVPSIRMLNTISENRSDYLIGEQILHLNVPRHISIIDDSNWITVLN